MIVILSASTMPPARKVPKSRWRSSPLAGLNRFDDLRLPAEVRHHRRNILRSEREDDLGYAPKEVIDSRPSSALIQTNSHGETSEARLSSRTIGTSFQIDPDSWLHHDHKGQGVSEDHEWSSEKSSSGRSLTPSSGEEDDELPPVEEVTSLTQMEHLLPSAEIQDELHKIIALLRELAQIEPDSFAVIDPYDFIQVLSFHSLTAEDKSKLDVIIRLRRHLTHRSSPKSSSMAGYKEKILLPFL
ncbi:hypothetical protein N0V93_000284 [Gnomoniopsis smithogilvyi]|uniref:Uncharacterized protein n=1 Tax=Gnomoniopsis smithogilvyi TaxID=1191159 RepID=A0A9W8YZI9_9PEZI|nr:hypothetical protein N0V93_000284 [Gnomoniopsis smithogilvyi]